MQYGLVHHYWRESPTVDVSLADTEVHVRIPIRFLEKSGNNTWAFVLRLLKYMVVEVGTLSLSPQAGQVCSPLRLTDAPEAGTYQFSPTCSSSVPVSQDSLFDLHLTAPGDCLTLGRGPESKQPYRAPKPSGSDSTMSNSKRSSSQQV